MGTFDGHILPGSSFLFFGIRWIYCILFRYFLCKREATLARTNARRFKSSIMFPSSCCPSFPAEAMLMFAAFLFISIGEFATAFKYGFLQNGQHLTMYSFFGLVSSVVIMKHYKMPVLPDADYVCFVFSYLINILLLYQHTRGKQPLEIMVHTYLIYVFMFGVAAILLEIKFRSNPTVAMVRALSSSVSGSWLVQMAFVLYSPISEPWPTNDHKYLIITTLTFAWHILANVMLIGFISMLVIVKVRSMSPAEVSLALDYEALDRWSNTHYKAVKLSDEQGQSLMESEDEDI